MSDDVIDVTSEPPAAQQLSARGEQILSDAIRNRRAQADARPEPDVPTRQERHERPDLPVAHRVDQATGGLRSVVAIIAVIVVVGAAIGILRIAAVPSAEVAGTTQEQTVDSGTLDEGQVEQPIAHEDATDETMTETIAADEARSDSAGQSADADADAAVVDLDPASIEVSVYDEARSSSDIQSFALRLKNVSVGEELQTSEFSVVVEDEQGTVAGSSTHFVHATLPTGRSALATVRTTEAVTGAQFVVVHYHDVVVVRLPIAEDAP